MIDPKNTVIITGGLVDTPEIAGGGKVAKLRLAMDWAGTDQTDPDNRSGYFNVTYFLSNDNPNAVFVGKQIEAGNFKKGSQLQLVGRLQQERWLDKETQAKRQQVVIIAEAITYSGSNRPADAEKGDATAGEASVPDSF